MIYNHKSNKCLNNIVSLNKNLKLNSSIPGEFYYIPGFAKYCINRNGEIYSIRSNKKMSTAVRTRRYADICIVNDDGVSVRFVLSRLVAACFLPDPRPEYNINDVGLLQVNHISGNKSDNSVSNLEWCTSVENVIHSCELGLNLHLPKNVERYNPETKEHNVYPSIKYASYGCCTSRDTIISRANSGGTKRYTDGFQYRWYTGDDIPWPEITTNRLGGENKRKVVVYDLLRRREVVYDSQKEASGSLVLCPAVLSTALSSDVQRVLPGLYLIQWEDSKKPWRKIVDPYEEYALESKNNVVIRVTRPSTGHVFLFTSAAECSIFTGCSTTNMTWRLKDKQSGSKVYTDGYTYQYYLDFLNKNKE